MIAPTKTLCLDESSGWIIAKKISGGNGEGKLPDEEAWSTSEKKRSAPFDAAALKEPDQVSIVVYDC